MHAANVCTSMTITSVLLHIEYILIKPAQIYNVSKDPRSQC